jgi:hypothetical protein
MTSATRFRGIVWSSDPNALGTTLVNEALVPMYWKYCADMVVGLVVARSEDVGCA